MERSKIWFLTPSGKCSLWNLNEDTLISRYASSIGGWALVWGGGGWEREVTAAQESAEGGCVANVTAAVTLCRGGGGGGPCGWSLRRLELKRAKCLEWAMSSATVAAWAVRASGSSARALAFFAAAEASSSAAEAFSSAMEVSSPWAVCTKPWRR